MLVRSPPRKPGSVSGISSPSSWLVLPTTDITTSAFFAAVIASGDGALFALVQINSACALPSLAPYVNSIATLRPFSRCTRPTCETGSLPPPYVSVTCLPSAVRRQKPLQRMPSRKSPDSFGVRKPDHCTPNVFLSATCDGRLSLLSFTL